MCVNFFFYYLYNSAVLFQIWTELAGQRNWQLNKEFYFAHLDQAIAFDYSQIYVQNGERKSPARHSRISLLRTVSRVLDRLCDFYRIHLKHPEGFK